MSNKVVSATRLIKATPEKIFAILKNPKRHLEIDGNSQLQNSIEGPEELFKGAKFSMKVKQGASYKVTNTVLEYEENSAISWCHLAKHIWKFELVDNKDGTSTVTEYWNWASSPLLVRIGMEALGYPKKNEKGMAVTLEKIAQLVE